MNIKNKDLTYGRGYVYSLQYHIVWCTKYRRKVLKDEVADDCKALLYSLAEEYRFEILAMEVMPDHIHLLLNTTPQFFQSCEASQKQPTAKKAVILCEKH